MKIYEKQIALIKSKERIQSAIEAREWVDIRSFLGNANWAIFYVFLGARECGKTVTVQDYIVNSFFKRHASLYWIRLNQNSMNKMLANNGEKFIDPIISQKYNLDITTRSGTVFNKGRAMIHCLTLSTAYNDKGSSIFDATNKNPIIVVLDEFEFEKGQKRTFDICYNLVLQAENICRSRKRDVKFIFLGNSTEDSSDILSMFNFIPEKFGIFKLKSKRCLMVNFKPSTAYKERRKGSVADILAGHSSNYTNERYHDVTLISKERLKKPMYIIKFSKESIDWFTVWNNNCICKWNKEKVPAIPMRRYLDETYTNEGRDSVYAMYDAKSFKFHNLITQTQFGYQLSLLKAK